MSKFLKSLDSARMSTVESQHRLVEFFPDYLNGCLSEKKHAEVESALAASSHLREELEFQSKLQVALRSDAEMADTVAVTIADSRGSGFGAVADRIVDSRFARIKDFIKDGWNGVGAQALMPAFALLLVVGVVANSTLDDSSPRISSQDIIEHETRMLPELYDQPTLRILPHALVGSEEFAVLLGDYGLRLELSLTESNMAEVTPVHADADIELLVAALKEDERVKSAKALPVSTAKE